MSNDNTEWKTIRVPAEDYEAASARKEDLGVTWGEYVNPDAIEESVADGVVGEVEVEPIVDTETIMSRLNEIEHTLPKQVADELEGRFR